MNANPENYLNYLEKEMHIMGVLSTFCLAVPVVVIERISSLDDKSLCRGIVATLLCNGWPLLVVACMFMLLGAAFFYLQRSRLAWTYGQIALETAIPQYTGKLLTDRLKEADSWNTWKPYHYAKSACTMAALGFIGAGLSVRFQFFHVHSQDCVVALVMLLVILVLWICRNSEKYNYEDSIRIPFISW